MLTRNPVWRFVARRWWAPPLLAFIAAMVVVALLRSPVGIATAAPNLLIVPWALRRWQATPGFGQPRMPFRHGNLGALLGAVAFGIGVLSGLAVGIGVTHAVRAHSWADIDGVAIVGLLAIGCLWTSWWGLRRHPRPNPGEAA